MAPQKIRVKEPTRRAGGCWEGLPDEVKFKLRCGKTREGTGEGGGRAFRAEEMQEGGREVRTCKVSSGIK